MPDKGLKSHSTSPAGLLFSLTALVFCLAAALLETRAPDAYYQLIQEDGPLEWATFWGFLLAGGLWLRQLQSGQRNVWRLIYLVSLGFGCLLLAMEEISWGQRLFGYLPPEKFLADNFQQEFNVHNFADTGTRQLLLGAVLLGPGVLWPLLRFWPWFRDWLFARGIETFPLGVLPGFLLAWVLQSLYPWHASGEWVELLAGLGYLAAAASFARSTQRDEPEDARPASVVATKPVKRLRSEAAWLLVTLLLGVTTTYLVAGNPQAGQLTLAALETEALAADFQVKRLRSRCGLHKRLYTFVEEYGARGMADSGFFADTDADSRKRKDYYLDPWNMPYWIRHRCQDDTSYVFVYSFGPNRRRDSSATEIGGDDVGAYVAPRSAERR